MAPNQSSLERLKALNSLQSVDAQLREVNELCTHSARAEMIAKWLFGRLQSNSDITHSADSWDALLSTLRLLPPERISSILGHSKLLETLQAAVDMQELGRGHLQSFARLLNFLLEQCEAHAGVSIRSVLRLPSGKAASFASSWLRRCLKILHADQKGAQDSRLEELHVPFRIWELRERTGDENDAFSQQCLTPCASLLSEFNLDNVPTTKRKRENGSGFVRPDLICTIESLLARHIFSPGREAFFKARASKNTKHVGSQRPSFAIESLLQPLGEASMASSSGHNALLNSLPSLLEIAIRSAPNPAPAQRPHEKPWIEAVFLALHDFNKSSTGQLSDAKALCGMLAVVTQRSRTISPDVLRAIVTTHAGLGAVSTDGINWELVAAVVDVDAALFKDGELGPTLFDAVTKSSIQLGEGSHQSAIDAETATMHTLWRDRIVVPVLKAFAQYNDFEGALRLCSQQLEEDLHGTFWSVWNDLDEPIQSLLEPSLTPDAVHTLSTRYCQIITDFQNDPDKGNRDKLGAAIVMLNALLGGINREETLDKLHLQLERCFQALMELHDVSVGPGLIPALQERKYWSLMTALFELWFPRYAAQEKEAAAAVAKVAAVLPRSVLDRAVDFSNTVRPNEYSSVQDPKSATDAKCFAATVCTQMLAFGGTVSAEDLRLYNHLLNNLGGNSNMDHKPECEALVLRSGALGLMDTSARQALLEGYVTGAFAEGAGNAASNLDALTTLASSAANSAQSQVLDDLIHAYFQVFEHNRFDQYKDRFRSGAILAQMLSEVPAQALTRPQREKILDKLCSWREEVPFPGFKCIFLVKPCLPLMLNLTALPNPTARICLEADVLAEMARELDRNLRTGIEGSDTILLCFEALVSRILQHCIKARDQERSRTMLIGLSSEAAKIIQSSRTDELDLPPITQYALVKAVFEELDANAVDDIKAQMPHRKPHNVKGLIGKLAQSIRSGLNNPSEHIRRSLDLLRSVSSTLVSASRVDLAPVLAKLATFLDERLEAVRVDGVTDLNVPSEALETSVMTRCYQTLAQFAPATPNIELVIFADGLLRLPLEPQDHSAVLETFELLFDHLGHSRAKLVQKFLSEGSAMPASRMLLLQRCVSKLEKADCEDSETLPPTVILHRLIAIASRSKDFTLSRRTLACIVDIFKTKAFMINQYNVETTLQVLHQLAQRSGAGKNILYLDICNALSVLLLHHRSRLHGRFHMLTKLLQTLLARLFEPLQGWPPVTARHPPTTKHAATLARLLRLFCEPPQPRRQTEPLPALVDASRKEQALVGTFVQHVLHAYCAGILHGTLGEGMREALRPGLWAMVEAMEMGGKEGGKALSASMTGAERAVLRGVYEEWRRFGKWRGG